MPPSSAQIFLSAQPLSTNLLVQTSTNLASLTAYPYQSVLKVKKESLKELLMKQQD
jgi:hypothetical protein